MFDIALIKATEFYGEDSSGLVLVSPNWVLDLYLSEKAQLTFVITRDEWCGKSVQIQLGKLNLQLTKKG